MDLKQRGFKDAPKLAVGDGALGFWKAVAKCCPDADQQRCWAHETGNGLEKLPKAMQSKVKKALHNIIGRQKQGKKRMQHLITVLNVSTRKIQKRWSAWKRVKISCWPFMNILQKTGNTLEQPIRSNRFLQLLG